MKKFAAALCGTALMTAVGIASAQPASASSTSGQGMTGSTAGRSMDFKKMDANNDGWVSREEYLGFYGSRYDTMKRGDRGVAWSDMQTAEGRFFEPGTTSNTTGNPVTNRAGTQGGVGNPPATGGGSK